MPLPHRQPEDPDEYATLAWRIAQELIRLRTARGLTQGAVSRATRIARPNIARLESARHEPTLRTLRTLARLYDVPLSSIVAVADEVSE